MDDLIIIGAGWAGMAAALYAWERKENDPDFSNLKIRVISQGIGSMVISPAWVSVWDSAPGDLIDAIQDLITRASDHPYALSGIESVKSALYYFSDFASKALWLPYSSGMTPTNHTVLTAMGAVRRVAIAPVGYDGFAASNPLFIGFEGWRDYYPILSGPNSKIIKLPIERPWDASPLDLAREFDKPAFRDYVISLIKPLSREITAVGFPAVLGLNSPDRVNGELDEALGVRVFEIPTLPPSVPGTRLFNGLRSHLLDQGVRIQIGHPVTRGIIENGRAVGVEVAAAGKPARFDAKAIILATGGLYGGGLFSDDRGHIWEPIFDLPVQYNPDRTTWFNEYLLDPRGHPVHYFGVRANDHIQPIDEQGQPIAENLFVAGQILAQPNVEGAPLPSDCVEGIALATAYKAVTCALEKIG